MKYQKILIIALLLSFIIIYLKKIIFSNNEKFDNNILSELEIMKQQDPSIQKKILFDSIDSSLEIGRGKQGKLITSNSNINENLLNLYISHRILFFV